MTTFHVKLEKFKTGEDKPFSWTVYNFDTLEEMNSFQNCVNEIYRQVSEKNNGVKTVNIKGEVKA